MPWWLDPLAAIVGGALALFLYLLAAGLIVGAIVYVAVKVFEWLDEHL